MRENIIQTKSYAFASRIVKAYRYLVAEHREYVLSKQLLRSGTSIGANVEEALAAASRADFVHKLTIAAKEARETNYWLRLLHDNDFLPTPIFPFFRISMSLAKSSPAFWSAPRATINNY
ncbi:four helix bundle protein [Hymenobacter latericus]|uniref:four helix bundle protein n=1 Tax=Hymenobacter sp. YIM 151858-1 TaxID=2987688 RepID=UPI0029D41748|nr:four helix bundle protein [Hymenobacter sp. YIM 151858-1]